MKTFFLLFFLIPFTMFAQYGPLIVNPDGTLRTKTNFFEANGVLRHGYNGGHLTNLDGTKIQLNSISSNSFDAETRALLGSGGGGSTIDTNLYTSTNRFQTNFNAQAVINTDFDTRLNLLLATQVLHTASFLTQASSNALFQTRYDIQLSTNSLFESRYQLQIITNAGFQSALDALDSFDASVFLRTGGRTMAGSITFQDDDQYNIGAIASGRPKHLYVAEEIHGGTFYGVGSGLSGIPSSGVSGLDASLSALNSGKQNTLPSGSSLQVLRKNSANTALEFATISAGSGDMLAANNLSEVVSPATARANIGAGTSSFDGVFASLTSKPTTVGGYGITDFNSLGDARWPLISHTHTFSSLTSKPTTISGYGIVDAFTQATADGLYSATGHSHTFASLTSKPTTLSGYGISDGQPLDSDLTTIAALTATTDNFLIANASAWASRTPAQAKTSLALVKGDVGLGSVDNTADTAKPVSMAQQTALDLKANLASPTFTGTVILPAATVTLANQANMATASLVYRKTAGSGAPEVNTLATLKTDLTLVKSDVGLGNVDNTSDVNKPVSTAQQTALDDKQPLDSDLTAIAALTTTAFGRGLLDDADGPAVRTTIGAGTSSFDGVFTSLTSKPTTIGGYGITDFNSLGDARWQPLDSDLTTIAALTATTDNFIIGAASAWASRTPAQAKTSLALVKGDVGLGSVDNTSDAGKPVSTAQQTALDLKANLASPTFTGTPTLPSGTIYTTDLTVQPTMNGGWNVYRVSGSDVTTTGQSLVDITNLVSGTLSASTLYEIEVVLLVTTSADTTGTKYGVFGGGSGNAATINAVGTGTTTAIAGSAAASSYTINAIATGGTTHLTTSGITGTVLIRGWVTTRSAGTPTISIQHLKVTSGTSTVKIGSIFRIRKA